MRKSKKDFHKATNNTLPQGGLGSELDVSRFLTSYWKHYSKQSDCSVEIRKKCIVNIDNGDTE